MRFRIAKSVLALAACLPTLAPAQQSAAVMALPHHEGGWELSVGGAGVYLDRPLAQWVQVTYAKTARLALGGIVRIGYHFSNTWGISAGSFVGRSTPATIVQPFMSITWTPNLDSRSSPFILGGVGGTLTSWTDTSCAGKSCKITGIGAHIGVGIRQALSENLALLVEARGQYERYDKASIANPVFNGTGIVGLSWFFGGRHGAAPMVAQAPPAAAPAPAAVPAAPPAAAPQAMSLEISPAADTLVALGLTQPLSVTARDANNNEIAGPEVTWGSSNPSIVSVNSSGLATAVRSGTATITASAGGQTATASVTVRPVVVAVSVTPANATITAAGGRQQFTAQATDTNGNPVTGRVITWDASAPNVAALSPSGLATGVGNGAALINATVDGMTGTAALTVNLPPAVTAAPAAAPAAPAAPNATLPAVNATVVVKNVNFRPNSARLPPEALANLDVLAAAMQDVRNARWEIGGYTSSMGDAARNLALSRRRALAVRAYLVRQGFPPARLVAVGYGAQNPIASNATAVGRLQNMRVEIKRLQ